jgi:ISXO2-like transposase domain
MQVIKDTTTPTLREFLLAHVEPGAVVITDGLSSYLRACGEEYEHRAGAGRRLRSTGARAAAEWCIQWLPWLRWLLGIHQGGVKPAHLQA